MMGRLDTRTTEIITDRQFFDLRFGWIDNESLFWPRWSHLRQAAVFLRRSRSSQTCPVAKQEAGPTCGSTLQLLVPCARSGCATFEQHSASASHKASGRRKITVHPRVCRERAQRHEQQLARVGSSPRVRGTLRPPAPRLAETRFIPVCAGNALRRSAARVAGSSPRVLGTLRTPRRHAALNRFIPACAGNAPGRRASPQIGAVHPRVCGERVSWCHSRATPIGSSPRVRERDVRAIKDDVGDGSSPRVRGTLRPHPASVRLRRFIPACAGNA